MFANIENCLTLGSQYIAAAAMYLGITLILGGTTLLDTLQASASGETGCSYVVNVMDESGTTTPVIYDGCPAGQQCCGGECISIDAICCEDGTSGNSDNCACCSAEGGLTSVTCSGE